MVVTHGRMDGPLQSSQDETVPWGIPGVKRRKGEIESRRASDRSGGLVLKEKKSFKKVLLYFQTSVAGGWEVVMREVGR
jgi:hypothetical protein